MNIFNLSNTGDLKISGNMYEDENIIFSLSPSGDLNVNSFNQYSPSDNPNTIMSIGAGGTQIAGQLSTATPKRNIIDIDNISTIDSATEILEETVEYIIASTQWHGTGITTPINLNPITNYRFIMGIEIIESNGGHIQFAIYNATRNEFLLNNVVNTSTETDVIQKFNIVFNSTDNVAQSDILEAGFVSDGSGSGAMIFKIFKDTLRIELEGEEEPEPVEPNPNEITFDEFYLVDDWTEILEETSEFMTLKAEWNGTGILFPINLKPNTTYELKAMVEIMAAAADTDVRFGVWNDTLGDYDEYSVYETSSQIGVIQIISARFTTDSVADISHYLELEINCHGDGPITFKLFKDISLTEI